jgi:DNA-binding transcriptional LysR family regulator
MASLEGALGTQLAARTPEGLVLNDAGELAAEFAETIDAGIGELLRRIGGDDQREEGLVRVSATESMTPFLMRGLQALRKAYPNIQVQLVVSNAAIDLVRREADVAIRLFREQNPVLVTRKLCDVGWSVYAARTHAEQRGLTVGAAPSPGWLDGQAIVSYRGPPARSAGGAWLSANTRREDVVLSCESVQAVASAVKAGLGVSVLPCFVGCDDPALVRITPDVVASVEAFVVIRQIIGARSASASSRTRSPTCSSRNAPCSRASRPRREVSVGTHVTNRAASLASQTAAAATSSALAARPSGTARPRD